MKSFKGFTLYFPSSATNKEGLHLRLTIPRIVTLSLLMLPLLVFSIGSMAELWSVGILEYRMGLGSIQRQIQLSRMNKINKESQAYYDAIQSMIQTDRICRISYGMKPIDSGRLQTGVGGTVSKSSETVEKQYHRDVIAALRLSEQFEFYSRQIKIIESSLDRVVKRIDNEQTRLLETPSIYPATGKISSQFGYRYHPVLGYAAFHEGLDFSGKEWSPILASADGIVVKAEYDNGGYGNIIEIRHPASGYQTRYAHLVDFNVSAGDVIKRGEQIGSMGNTGRSTGTHLHYEVLENGKPIDPEDFLVGKFVVVSK